MKGGRPLGAAELRRFGMTGRVDRPSRGGSGDAPGTGEIGDWSNTQASQRRSVLGHAEANATSGVVCRTLAEADDSGQTWP